MTGPTIFAPGSDRPFAERIAARAGELDQEQAR